MCSRAINTIVCTLLLFTSLNAAAQVQVRTKQEAVTQILSDLKALRALRFSNLSDAHLRLFGAATNGPSRFVDSRVRSFYFAESMPLGEASISTVDGHPNTLTVTPKYFDKPLIKRLSSLIHEARHVDPDDTGHIICPPAYIVGLFGKTVRIPFFDYMRGTPMCEANDRGGYSAAYVFLTSVENSCENCTAQMIDDAEQTEWQDGILRIQDPVAAERLYKDSHKDWQTQKATVPGYLDFFANLRASQ